jgi:hypothetical protein
MLTQAQIEDHGTRIREALEVIGLRWPGNPQPADFLYLYAVVSNFLVLLEQDHGVMPGVFGSHGGFIQPFNPASGAIEQIQRNSPGVGAAGLKAQLSLPLPPDP